ncbi:DAO-domain-containing protein [Periconia macrospinosa]|uniref:DAO-domain-containing protein n=1 Tax=Periconia macrospinosa TaxID=97972 RepID=A0A2V1DLS0_9PLEO|nr:DAO-domain-containing protein [Periconia macrospinosa]
MWLSSAITVLQIAALIPEVRALVVRSPQIPIAKRDGIDQTVLAGFPVKNPTASYWQEPPHRIANLRTTPHLPTSETFDYVIIGSGVSGASVAMKLLSRDPNLSILMLEARTAASAASGRNGGHCKAGDWKDVKEWVELYGEDEALRIGKMEQDCVDDLRAFVRANNVSSGWQDVETADVYWTKAAFEKAADIVKYQEELEKRRPNDGPWSNKRRVYAGQAARDYWKWPQILGAVAYTSHTQNPYLTVCSILEKGLEKGLNLQTNTMALALNQLNASSEAGAKWEVKTDRGTVKGKAVVLTTNSYTNALHPGLASTGFLTPQRAQVAAVHPEKDTSNNTVFLRSHSYPDLHSGNNYIAIRAPGDIGAGDVIIGGSSKFSPTRERNITDDSVINQDMADDLRAVGRVVFGYENWGETTTVVKEWTGIICNTPDGFPVVGGLPAQDGLWASVCMNGHGMAWAFRAAEALVDMMTEGEAPEWFPQSFDIARAFNRTSKS